MSQKSYLVVAIVAGGFGLAAYVLAPSLESGTPWPFSVATALAAMVAIIASLRAIRMPRPFRNVRS